MKKFHSIQSAEIKKGTRILLRADLDIGIKNGKVQDDMRLQAGIPTIRYLLDRGACIRMIGYRGRPDGTYESRLSLRPLAHFFEKALAHTVVLIENPLDEKMRREYDNSSDILLFENIRFWSEEIKNNASFARRLAEWGDIYVNDAFANAHRREASLVALPKLLPAYAGLRLLYEVSVLEKLLMNPKRPFVAILGGAKLETKLPLLRQMLKKADHVLVAGALANSLFAAKGFEVGKSKVDVGQNAWIGSLLSSKKLLLPADVVAIKNFESPHSARVTTPDHIAPDEWSVDIGPAAIGNFRAFIGRARTIVWNGPLGYVEIPLFARGTRACAHYLVSTDAIKIVGGGDTIAALRKYKLLERFTHVSTGGGAMLEFLAGKKLPALEALKR